MEIQHTIQDLNPEIKIGTKLRPIRNANPIRAWNPSREIVGLQTGVVLVADMNEFAYNGQFSITFQGERDGQTVQITIKTCAKATINGVPLMFGRIDNALMFAWRPTPPLTDGPCDDHMKYLNGIQSIDIRVEKIDVTKVTRPPICIGEYSKVAFVYTGTRVLAIFMNSDPDDAYTISMDAPFVIHGQQIICAVNPDNKMLYLAYL